MLISVDSQDNSKWAEISKLGVATTWAEFSQTSKMHRFEHAFNSLIGLTPQEVSLKFFLQSTVSTYPLTT